jgi:hypothetical protein
MVFEASAQGVNTGRVQSRSDGVAAKGLEGFPVKAKSDWLLPLDVLGRRRRASTRK